MNYQANYNEKEQRLMSIPTLIEMHETSIESAKKRIKELKEEKRYLEEEE